MPERVESKSLSRRLAAFSGFVTGPKDSPDRDTALDQYRARAGVYDLELALFEPIRRHTVEQLALKRGDTVIDVGCGTGLSLPLLQERVGAGGRVIAVEQSPEMLGRASERARQNGWKNVTLLNSPVEDAAIPADAGAALFHFTHDILRTPAAIANIFRHLKPGARVAAAGLKWAPMWAMPVNLFVWQAAMRSVTSLAGLRAPWSNLERFVPGLVVERMLGGGVYVARGTTTVSEPID
ncbi:MAG TPA: methyltransferase domain-containing protein [Candidatus Binataceae bacterium]|jgi:ubiquinone/menaquinone biosynthesis C-methylase UbiE